MDRYKCNDAVQRLLDTSDRLMDSAWDYTHDVDTRAMINAIGGVVVAIQALVTVQHQLLESVTHGHE